MNKKKLQEIAVHLKRESLDDLIGYFLFYIFCESNNKYMLYINGQRNAAAAGFSIVTNKT